VSATFEHWNQVYAASDHKGSWFRTSLQESIEAIRLVAPHAPCDLLDVGAGRQHLRLGDIFGKAGTCTSYALDMSFEILGPPEPEVHYIAGDVLTTPLPEVDVWHDRAVVHFFTDEADRATYRQRAAASVRPGGGIVVACFDLDGPERCSGLIVARRSPEQLAEEFAVDFAVVELRRSVHVTPTGAEQRFAWFLGRRI